MGGTRGVFFLSFFFFLPLSLSITLSIITQQLQKWWSKHSLNFFSDCSRRRRRSVARVTTTLLPKPRRGRTERERVLWPVYLDNPTCRIRIEKGSRSLSFSCQPYSIKEKKKNLAKNALTSYHFLFPSGILFLLMSVRQIDPSIRTAFSILVLHSLWPKGICLFLFFTRSLAINYLYTLYVKDRMQMLSVIIRAQYSDWSVKRFGVSSILFLPSAETLLRTFCDAFGLSPIPFFFPILFFIFLVFSLELIEPHYNTHTI